MFSSLVASDSHWESVIIEKMLLSMSTEKTVTIYSKSEHIHDILNSLDDIHFVKDCQKADFVLLDEKEIDESCTKPEIVFNYGKYHNNINAVGVFFWQKGRPTIRFSEKHLHAYGLAVKGELSKYVSPSD